MRTSRTKKPRKRTPAQRLDAVVLRAMRLYGEHLDTCQRHGWGGMQAQAHISYRAAQKAIRRVLREVAHV